MRLFIPLIPFALNLSVERRPPKPIPRRWGIRALLAMVAVAAILLGGTVRLVVHEQECRRLAREHDLAFSSLLEECGKVDQQDVARRSALREKAAWHRKAWLAYLIASGRPWRPMPSLSEGEPIDEALLPGPTTDRLDAIMLHDLANSGTAGAGR